MTRVAWVWAGLVLAQVSNPEFPSQVELVTRLMQESHEQVEVRAGEGETPGWRSLAREFDLSAGASQARVVLRDPRTGAMGAVSHRFEVPSTGALRLTTPILTDRVEREKAEPTPIASDARGRVVRLIGIGMDGLSEGDYQLVLEVRDEVSGTRIERREPFALRSLPD